MDLNQAHGVFASPAQGASIENTTNYKVSISPKHHTCTADVEGWATKQPGNVNKFVFDDGQVASNTRGDYSTEFGVGSAPCNPGDSVYGFTAAYIKKTDPKRAVNSFEIGCSGKETSGTSSCSHILK